MTSQVSPEARPREREQHLVHERDGRGGALDIEEDRADAAIRQPEIHARGK